MGKKKGDLNETWTLSSQWSFTAKPSGYLLVTFTSYTKFKPPKDFSLTYPLTFLSELMWKTPVNLRLILHLLTTLMVPCLPFPSIHLVAFCTRPQFWHYADDRKYQDNMHTSMYTIRQFSIEHQIPTISTTAIKYIHYASSMLQLTYPHNYILQHVSVSDA